MCWIDSIGPSVYNRQRVNTMQAAYQYMNDTDFRSLYLIRYNSRYVRFCWHACMHCFCKQILRFCFIKRTVVVSNIQFERSTAFLRQWHKQRTSYILNKAEFRILKAYWIFLSLLDCCFHLNINIPWLKKISNWNFNAHGFLISREKYQHILDIMSLNSTMRSKYLSQQDVCIKVEYEIWTVYEKMN